MEDSKHLKMIDPSPPLRFGRVRIPVRFASLIRKDTILDIIEQLRIDRDESIQHILSSVPRGRQSKVSRSPASPTTSMPRNFKGHATHLFVYKCSSSVDAALLYQKIHNTEPNEKLNHQSNFSSPVLTTSTRSLFVLRREPPKTMAEEVILFLLFALACARDPVVAGRHLIALTRLFVVYVFLVCFVVLSSIELFLDLFVVVGPVSPTNGGFVPPAVGLQSVLSRLGSGSGSLGGKARLKRPCK